MVSILSLGGGGGASKYGVDGYNIASWQGMVFKGEDP